MQHWHGQRATPWQKGARQAGKPDLLTATAWNLAQPASRKVTPLDPNGGPGAGYRIVSRSRSWERSRDHQPEKAADAKNAVDYDGRPGIRKRNLLVCFTSLSHLAAGFLTALGLPF